MLVPPVAGTSDYKIKMIPISFEKKDIGGLIKSSKQHFKWKFELEGKLVTVEVLSSKLSGRQRVYRDGFLICDD